MTWVMPAALYLDGRLIVAEGAAGFSTIWPALHTNDQGPMANKGPNPKTSSPYV